MVLVLTSQPRLPSTCLDDGLNLTVPWPRCVLGGVTWGHPCVWESGVEMRLQMCQQRALKHALHIVQREPEPSQHMQHFAKLPEAWVTLV